MNNSFDLLLTKCKSHHRKKVLKTLFYAILLLSAVSVGALYMYGDLLFEGASSAVVVKKMVAPVKKELQKPHKSTKIEPKKESVKTVAVEKKVQKPLRKDVDYQISVDEDYLSSYTKKEKSVKVKISKKSTKEKREPLHVSSKNRVEKEKKDTTLLVSTKKLVSIKDLSAQFEKEPRYNLALKIAQAYYDKGDYFKSSLWAKKANMLDKVADGAWIMYAKSEYAKGKKARAKEILNLYLANKPSKDAQSLLMTWDEEK